MANERKLREEGVFHLDEDPSILEEMEFQEDNVFGKRGNFINHRIPTENNNVFGDLRTVNISEMETAEGTNLANFLENLVLNEL